MVFTTSPLAIIVWPTALVYTAYQRLSVCVEDLFLSRGVALPEKLKSSSRLT